MAHRFLSDGNISLRAVEISDADFMWNVECDSLQWVQNSMVAPFSKENILQYALNYEADPFKASQLRLIITSSDDIRIGIADIFEISSQHRTAKVGIYILPSFRNHGYAATALELLEDYALKILNIRTLCAEVVEGNDISLQLFVNSGYKKVGYLEDWLLSGSKTYSLQILQKKLGF
ncbi:MAG: GNAT family N-acetyltransferase [Muribaculaceae bacterium]|nr:GNAT family N-acetyltransferase [Muribaculaceae bacterium]